MPPAGADSKLAAKIIALIWCGPAGGSKVTFNRSLLMQYYKELCVLLKSKMKLSEL